MVLFDDMNNKVVYSSGPTPCPIMGVGEMPGRFESAIGEPFVGPSGEILSTILYHCGDNPPYHRAGVYLTNLVKDYIDGNPDPTPDQIMYWTEELKREAIACQPKVILAIGRFAAWWFLGGWHKRPMRDIHGRPCRGGELYSINDIDNYPEFITASCIEDLETDYRNRAQGAVIVPCLHPANALPDRDPKGRMMATVYRDFDTAIKVYELGHSSKVVYDAPHDSFDGIEKYIDATGAQVADYISTITPSTNILAIDTEDGPGGLPWSIQVCSETAYALTLRCAQPDLQRGIDAIQDYIDLGGLVVLHFAMHDLSVMRAMGIDTSDINLADTGYMLYLLDEPQGLKVAQWRHCGMTSEDYLDVVGDAGRDAMLRYLLNVVARQYPSPGKFSIVLNNGTEELYRPQSLSTKAGRILKDLTNGKDVNIKDRWTGVSGKTSGHARVLTELYQRVEDDLGVFPSGWLDDVYNSGPAGSARVIRYASRDADATYRVYLALLPKLQQLGLA